MYSHNVWNVVLRDSAAFSVTLKTGKGLTYDTAKFYMIDLRLYFRGGKMCKPVKWDVHGKDIRHANG